MALSCSDGKCTEHIDLWGCPRSPVHRRLFTPLTLTLYSLPTSRPSPSCADVASAHKHLTSEVVPVPQSHRRCSPHWGQGCFFPSRLLPSPLAPTTSALSTSPPPLFPALRPALLPLLLFPAPRSWLRPHRVCPCLYCCCLLLCSCSYLPEWPISAAPRFLLLVPPSPLPLLRRSPFLCLPLPPPLLLLLLRLPAENWGLPRSAPRLLLLGSPKPSTPCWGEARFLCSRCS